MKFSACTAAIASASFFSQALSGPVKLDNQRLGRRSGEHEDKSKNKYFHEPGGSYDLSHYDARYFSEIVSYEERTDTQLHMIRAYLDFFREKELDTWIAHGTLLGWWWNGKRLPWDWDMDTQVSAATLHHLGQHHNQTRHKYVSEDGKVEREYLLDVNPWIWERERGDGMNIIDARWVDVRNGLFIDITGLSETHPDTAPGTWSCKNYHRYKTHELYPMRETTFEGVPAKVPYSYDKILIDEYKEKALTVTEYEGHRWDSALREWVKTEQQIRKEQKAAEDARKAEEDARKAAEEALKQQDDVEDREDVEDMEDEQT